MIARRIDHKAANDNYRALALYVAAAGHEDEKALMSWTAGCLDDDYLSGIHEVEATQALNKTSAKPKSYHLMVSFRPEEEAKLSSDDFKAMEQEFAAVLGFSDHQRHAGVHRNTDNLHLHVAFNMIEPGRFKRVEPFRDFRKLAEACRRLEQKYGLAIDRGADGKQTQEGPTANAKVKSIEAQTGQESLFSYIVRHKPGLTAEMEKAVTWSDLHATFLKCGLHLKVSGNGLTIQDRHSKHSAKASALDKAWSKTKLESRFGQYEAPSADLLRTVQATQKYNAAPLQVKPERDNLYQVFLGEMETRRAALEIINQEGARLYEDHKTKWEQKNREMDRLPMLKHDCQRTRLGLKKQAQDELAELRAEVAAKRQVVREDRPYTSWGKYLQHLAVQGHETALAILRSKNEEVRTEAVATPATDQQPSGQYWEIQKQAVMSQPGISDRHRKALLVVLEMRELLASEPGQSSQVLKFKVDTKGTVIFTLPGGGTIRDTGREIHFSAHDESVKTLAHKFAKMRWGDHAATVDGNRIRMEDARDTSKRDHEPGR